MQHLAIFASGAGTNANAIIQHFKKNKDVCVSLVVTNKSDAGVTNYAAKEKVGWVYVPKADFEDSEMMLELLKAYKIDWIILAGWLLLVPPYLISAYYNKIVNIHPALLPKFGGKGMFGHHVHRAVFESGELESGITIHFVNERFDEGKIIFQKTVTLPNGASPENIEKLVRKLELQHYPVVIEQLIK